MALTRRGLDNQRGESQTVDGRRTYLTWAQDHVVLPTVRIPDSWDARLSPGQLSLASGVIITTRGLDSAIRGVLVGTKRPDMVIIDDPETGIRLSYPWPIQASSAQSPAPGNAPNPVPR